MEVEDARLVRTDPSHRAGFERRILRLGVQGRLKDLAIAPVGDHENY